MGVSGGVLGDWQDSRYSGARRCIGGIRQYWGLLGDVGDVGGIRGCWGCQGCIRGGKWTGSLTTLGPSPGCQHSQWFPWGSDLPGQGQASDRNELCRLLYTFGTIFHDSFLHFYLHHLITYSYMQYKEMLYGLFSLQTNLHISLCHQSDV